MVDITSLRYTVKSINSKMFLPLLLLIGLILFIGDLTSSQSYFAVVESTLTMCFTSLYLGVTDGEKDAKFNDFCNMGKVESWVRSLSRYLVITAISLCVFTIFYILQKLLSHSHQAFNLTTPYGDFTNNFISSAGIFLLSLLVLSQIYLGMRVILSTSKFVSIGVVVVFWVLLSMNENFPIHLFGLSHDLPNWFRSKLIWLAILIATGIIEVILIHYKKRRWQ